MHCSVMPTAKAKAKGKVLCSITELGWKDASMTLYVVLNVTISEVWPYCICRSHNVLHLQK